MAYTLNGPRRFCMKLLQCYTQVNPVLNQYRKEREEHMSGDKVRVVAVTSTCSSELLDTHLNCSHNGAKELVTAMCTRHTGNHDIIIGTWIMEIRGMKKRNPV
jgi:hypothetical protein